MTTKTAPSQDLGEALAQAVQNAADSLGLSVEETLRRVAESLRRAANEPGPCFSSWPPPEPIE